MDDFSVDYLLRVKGVLCNRLPHSHVAVSDYRGLNEMTCDWVSSESLGYSYVVIVLLLTWQEPTVGA